MNLLTPSKKEKILSRLFWDVEVNQADIEQLIHEKIRTIEDVQSQQFFCRLLTSCDWYTLLKLIPSGKWEVILSDRVLDRLFPKDLKNKYVYARNLLSYIRIFVEADGITLKIDFVNDVPSRFGDIEQSSVFHRIDNWRNILSNKICALSRLESKDIADIVFIARKYSFEWETIIAEGKEKDLWVDPIEICRTIDQFPTELLKTIKWIGNVNIEAIEKQITVIHHDIFTGAANSLAAGNR